MLIVALRFASGRRPELLGSLPVVCFLPLNTSRVFPTEQLGSPLPRPRQPVLWLFLRPPSRRVKPFLPCGGQPWYFLPHLAPFASVSLKEGRMSCVSHNNPNRLLYTSVSPSPVVSFIIKVDQIKSALWKSSSSQWCVAEHALIKYMRYGFVLPYHYTFN